MGFALEKWGKALLGALGAVLSGEEPAAQSSKVNGELARDQALYAGTLGSALFSPDGAWVVYGTSGPLRLYSAPADGSGAQRSLFGALQIDAIDANTAISASTNRVVFRSHAGLAGKLYTVPIDGSSTPLRLDPELGQDGAQDYRLSPDGTWVVYVAQQESGLEGLFRVRADGSGPTLKLADETPTSGAFQGFHQFAPDGRHVFFVLGLHGVLQRVPLDGSAPALPLSAPGHRVSSFALSPDSTRVVYREELHDGLHSVPSDGGAVAVQLNSPLPPDARVWTYRVDPSGLRVAYVADQLTKGKDELFSVPIDGSLPSVRVNAPLSAGWEIAQFGSFAFAHDGSRLVFVQALGTVSSELWSAAADGGSVPIRLSDPMPGPRPNPQIQFRLDLGGVRVLYTAEQLVDGVLELFVVPIDGSSPPLRLNGPLVTGGQVRAFGVGEQRVVYAADQAQLGTVELWSRWLDGSGSALRLNDPFTIEDVATPFRVMPDGLRVLYGADTNVDGQNRPFVVPLDRSHAPIDLAAASVTPVVGDVSLYSWSPDGAVLYVADELLDERHGLFSARGGRGPGVALHPVFDLGERVVALDVDRVTRRALYLWTRPTAPLAARVQQLFGVSLDGSGPPQELDLSSPRDFTGDLRVARGGRVLFRRESSGGSHPEPGSSLASARADGSGSPAVLHDQDDTSVVLYEPDPTGQRAVYVVSANGSQRLRSMRLDGSGVSVPIDRGTHAGVTDFRFRIHPDGQSVFYVADDEVDGKHELWRTPIDGSAAPVRLSPVLAADRDVDADFVLTPDGARILFRCDLAQDERHNLFSVSTAGGSSVRLGGPLGPGGDVAHFLSTHVRIGPDGTRALYAADQRLDEVYELFLVPIDGSQPALALNPPFSGGRDLQLDGACFTPDGARVVYVADQETDGVHELFSVPAAGGASVKLSGPMAAGGGVLVEEDGARGSFALESSGEHVVYLADQDVAGRFELFSVAVEGGRAPVRRNGELVPHGDVKSFAPGPGRAVLYLADEEGDEVFELFRSVLPVAERGPVRSGGAAGGLPGRTMPGR